MNPTRLLLVVLAFFAALVSANKDFLIFDPANITIENAMAYTTFKVKLAYAINGTATVNFQANGISLSVCSLSFNATDYSVFKSVKILPNPSLNDSGNTNININAQICAAGTDHHQTTQVVFAIITLFPESLVKPRVIRTILQPLEVNLISKARATIIS